MPVASNNLLSQFVLAVGIFIYIKSPYKQSQLK
jgi:hypothetical protein